VLWKQKHDGRVQPVNEEDEYAMYAHTLDRLEQVGLPAYEISNFSAPGHECRHNLVYWANDPYFGVGLGAARFVDGTRAVNTRDLKSYVKRMESGLDPTGPIEQLDPEAHARETAVLMLRRLQLGLSRRDFTERTGMELDALVGDMLTRHVSKGWLEDDGERLRLTRSGLFVADTVMADFL
ncbi:MAG TPA: coproporphyrinogen III oxidase, partial [Isosphaeraceae bacterium]|nr:coproporphyrinogen III oxidase [Isosphaeraceae bacterium]